MYNDTYTIIGIDPGNNLGIGILHIDSITNEIVGIESRTYILDTYVREETFNVLLERCSRLRELVIGLVMEYRPLMFCIESSFMNSRFPKSVIQLSQYVGTIELAIRNTNLWCKILKVPPKYIKARCGAGGSAGKDEMRDNLQAIPAIAKKVDLSAITEHGIDSLAMAYVAYLEILDQPYLLWSLPF